MPVSQPFYVLKIMKYCLKHSDTLNMAVIDSYMYLKNSKYKTLFTNYCGIKYLWPFFCLDASLGILSARDLDGPMEIRFTIKDEVTRSLVRLSEHFGESTVNRSVEIILIKQLDRDHVSILIDTKPKRKLPTILHRGLHTNSGLLYGLQKTKQYWGDLKKHRKP
jgi:hypothetical protein